MDPIDGGRLDVGDEQRDTLLDAAGLTKRFPVSKDLFRRAHRLHSRRRRCFLQVVHQGESGRSWGVGMRQDNPR